MAGEGYVEFNSYLVRSTKVLSSRVIRVYDAVNGVASLFPFVTEVTLNSSRGEGTYYELRNSNNIVVYVTDADGIRIIFPIVRE